MVELFTTRYFRARAGVDAPVPPVARWKLPTPDELNKPCGNFTRYAVKSAMRPEPLVRDYLFTRFPHHGPRRANAHARKRTGKSIDDGFSPSPLFRAIRQSMG